MSGFGRGLSGPVRAIFLTVMIVGCMGARAADDPPPRKPTVEELEERIQLLERRLDLYEARDAKNAVQPVAPAPINAAAPTPAVPPAVAVSPPQRAVTVQEAASATESSPQIFAGPTGFSFQSPDGANQIRFHGEFDFDGRFYNDDLTPAGSRSGWLLRRARPIIEGTFANIFDFRFNPDFAGGKTVIQDAFVAARFNPLFVVTAGKFKEPFGLERLQLSPNNRFIELGLPSDLVPNRDLGVQVSGTWKYPSGTLTYQVGWFNGVNDGTSTDANATPDIDNNDDKDWVARVFAQPFLTSNITALKGLGAGFAVSYVNQVGSSTNTLLPVYKTETQRNFFTYDPTRAATPTLPAAGAAYADGTRLRLSPQAYYYVGSLGLLTEYVHESQEVGRVFGTGSGAVLRRATVKPESWQLMANYLLTGDKATFGSVAPLRPFALGQPGWGAFEVAARISSLRLDPISFTAPSGASTWFADPSSQPNKATAWTLGLNWYLTQNVAWYLDYTSTHFDGGAPAGLDRANEDAFLTRFQVAF
jgi:phosphate-selective porin OprO and OprP